MCVIRADESRIRKRDAPAFGEFRRLSTRLASVSLRSLDLPRSNERCKSSNVAPQRLRRRWNVRKHWAHRSFPERSFSAAENSPLPPPWRTTTRGRYQGCNVVQGRWTIDPFPSYGGTRPRNRRVRRDRFSSRVIRLAWKRGKKTIGIFASLVQRSEISRSRTRTMYIQEWKYR